jgi:hypothetical protein
VKDKIYICGITLIGISLIICVISFYLLIFGIPIFIIGGVFVFISKQTIKTKVLTALIPIILYVPLTILFLMAYNYSTPKTILIPSEFEGTLRIVYEEECGNNYNVIGGTKTLKFPKNGILILNEDFDNDINYKYYLIDKLGNKKEIPQTFFCKSNITKIPCVLIGSSGTIGLTELSNSTNKEQKGITYTDFYVFNKDTTDRDENKYQQKFDSLTEVIVNQCRQKK